MTSIFLPDELLEKETTSKHGYRFFFRECGTAERPVILVRDPLGFHQTLIQKYAALEKNASEAIPASLTLQGVPHEITTDRLMSEFADPALGWLHMAYATVTGDPSILTTLNEIAHTLASPQHEWLKDIIRNSPKTPEDILLAQCCTPGARAPASEEVAGNDHAREYLRSRFYAFPPQYAASPKGAIHHIKGMTRDHVRGMWALYRNRAKQILDAHDERDGVFWGMNYGFGISLTGKKLGGSGQHVHMQYFGYPSYMITKGDAVARICAYWKKEPGLDYFELYLDLLRCSPSVSGNGEDVSLVIWENNHVMLAVPPAQQQSYELQIICKKAGHIAELSDDGFESLCEVWHLVFCFLAHKDIQFFTAHQIARRFSDEETSQRLVYVITPSPQSESIGYLERGGTWLSRNLPEEYAAEARCYLCCEKLIQ